MARKKDDNASGIILVIISVIAWAFMSQQKHSSI